MNNADEALDRAMQDKLRFDLQKIKTEYEKGLGQKTEQIIERLERELRSRFINVALAVLAVVVLAVVGAAYKSMQDVNKSVIDLQDRILAAQEVIGTATKELETSRSQLSTAKDELASAEKELEDTRKEYETRLAELKGAQSAAQNAARPTENP